MECQVPKPQIIGGKVNFILVGIVWIVALYLGNKFGGMLTITKNRLEILCVGKVLLAILLLWFYLFFWGEVSIQFYLWKFDLDGNGIVENNELTTDAISAGESGAQDTWRLFFAIAVPMLYSIFGIVEYVWKRFRLTK
jgi:hypothetical protein